MEGFGAMDNIEPQRNTRYYRYKKRKPARYIWAVIAMFIMVLMLCANNYTLLNSYENLKTELQSAYIDIGLERNKRIQLEKESAELQNRYRRTAEEMEALKGDYDSASRGTDDLSIQLEKLKKQNSELSKQLKDLSNDNIALQNTLKMAASIGVKPQSYSLFKQLTPRDTLNRGKYLGKFLGTAYTPSKEECGNDKGITKCGEPIIPGVSVAIDNSFWPFGTVFYIKGLGYTVAMDTGSAVKGKYRFDFSVLDRDFAMKLGSRQWDVYLIKMGKGSMSGIKL